jgi:hypothetical protein
MEAKINLNFSPELDQVSYLQGFHRSGWNYVVQELFKLNHSDGIICDTYVDRTFHWKKPSFLPYTKPWVGFIHHTFDTTFSDYNNHKLFQNIQFIQSLEYCKGLFVFGKTHEKTLIQKLNHEYFFDIPVVSLIHPTETPDVLFDFSLFENNPQKKIIQIGAWLRHNYSIYKLNNGINPIQPPDGDLILHKCALKGKNMDNYFKPSRFLSRFVKKIHTPIENTFKTLDNTLFTSSIIPSKISVNAFPPRNIPIYIPQEQEQEQEQDDQLSEVICRGGHDGYDQIICRDGISRSHDRNKYVKGAMELLTQFDSSVTIIPHLDNEHYDTLLSQNVVFLHLIDSAAVNTLIECIIRNTPIVINKTHTVVELLGPHYPLYFESLDDIPQFQLKNYLDAHTYLLNMNKHALSLQYFITSFQQQLRIIETT